MSAIQLGDVPTWVAAVGTTGALVFAFTGWNAERADRRRQAARERRAQVRLVTIAHGLRDVGGSLGEVWRVTGFAVVHNRSDEPISDLKVTVELHEGAAWRAYGPLDPTAVIVPVPVVDARKDHEVVGSFNVPSVVPNGLIGVDQTSEVVFTDQQGQRWCRRSDGDLYEVAD